MSQLRRSETRYARSGDLTIQLPLQPLPHG